MAASYSNTKPAVPIVSKIAGLVGSPTANYGIQSPAPKPQTLPGLGSQPGMIAPQFTQPATPVKSTSITQPNGTVITQTHHTETTPTTKKSTSTNSPAVAPPAYDHTTGFLTDYGRSQGLKEVNGQTGSNPGMINQNTPAPGPTKNPPPGNTVGSQLGNVSDTGGQTQNEYDTQQQVINQSKNQGQAYTDAMNVYNKDVEDLRKLREAEAGSMAGEANRAIPLNFVQGRQQVLQNQYGQREAALGSEIGAAANVLSAANQNQGLQNSQASTAYSGAQSQAGRNAGVQQGILGAVAPGQLSGSARLYNPAESIGGNSSIQSGVNNQTAYDLGIKNKIVLQPALDTLKANSTLLNNTVSAAGTNYGNQPYLNALSQMVQHNLLNPAALSAFKNMIGQLKVQGINIDDSASLSSIKSQLDSEQATRTNEINANQKIINSSSGGTTGGSSTGYKNGGAF